MERADEIAGGCEIRVLLGGHFQGIGHCRIGIRRIGHAPCLSRIEPQPFSTGGSQIQGHQRIELMRMLDGCDRSEHPIRLIDARAVERLDAVEIELHHAARCQFASLNRALDVLDRRFFDPEGSSLRRNWRRHEQDERCQ